MTKDANREEGKNAHSSKHPFTRSAPRPQSRSIVNNYVRTGPVNTKRWTLEQVKKDKKRNTENDQDSKSTQKKETENNENVIHGDLKYLEQNKRFFLAENQGDP